MLDFVVADRERERGGEGRNERTGVENGDLGFGMIPGGAGFGLCLYSFSSRIAGCARVRAEGGDVYLRRTDICVFGRLSVIVRI